ncbi:hypothetical protein [Lysobacter claricitrinus]|uniref:hypothetical protein n=1 Tax=Lysobacter claricitrinus TaxID=3367728 RepID=UPI0038B347A1
MKRSIALVAAALLGATSTASAREVAAQCSASVNGVAYYSDLFQYDLGDKEPSQFGDIWNSPQEKDFTAYLRRTYGATGDETVHCSVDDDGEREESNSFTFNGTTVSTVQTGYVPQGH